MNDQETFHDGRVPAMRLREFPLMIGVTVGPNCDDHPQSRTTASTDAETIRDWLFARRIQVPVGLTDIYRALFRRRVPPLNDARSRSVERTLEG